MATAARCATCCRRRSMTSFDAAIKEREKHEQKTETRFVSIDKAELIGAELRDRTAQLTVAIRVADDLGHPRQERTMSSTAMPDKVPTSPTSGPLLAISPLAIRTGSWSGPEARTKPFRMKNSATALSAAVAVDAGSVRSAPARAASRAEPSPSRPDSTPPRRAPCPIRSSGFRSRSPARSICR